MATSEPLVPTGLEYGARKEVKAGMARAGMPVAPTGQSGAASFITQTAPTARPVRPDFDPLTEAAPDQFGFLTGGGGGGVPQPVTETPDNAAVFAQLAANAGSGLARAVAADLAARRGA